MKFGRMAEKLSGFLVLLFTAARLAAAPPEPVQKPVKLLGLGTGIDQEFAKLTNIGITPFLSYYGVFQGNPIGGVEQRTAYSHLILFGATLNFDKLCALPGGSLTISGAEAEGKNLSENIGNVNTVSEAFVTPHTLLFYELYWKQRPTAEHVLEASYPIYITNNYTIQPDIQYIIRPNGTGDIRDSLVIGIQFIANY